MNNAEENISREEARNKWRKKVWPKHLLKNPNREVYAKPDLTFKFVEEATNSLTRVRED